MNANYLSKVIVKGEKIIGLEMIKENSRAHDWLLNYNNTHFKEKK